MYVVVTIGNSDNKLTQGEWSRLVYEVGSSIMFYQKQRHGEFFSPPASKYQNACWLFEVKKPVDEFQEELMRIAQYFKQDSIFWMQSETPLFLRS